VSFPNLSTDESVKNMRWQN